MERSLQSARRAKRKFSKHLYSLLFMGSLAISSREARLANCHQSFLYGFLNLRYIWETGARTSLQGNTFVATLTFPVPSIALQ